MPWLKAVEVLVVVGAGAAFVWWQWRDVTRALAQSRREREAREAQAAQDRARRSLPVSQPASGVDRSTPPSESLS